MNRNKKNKKTSIVTILFIGVFLNICLYIAQKYNYSEFEDQLIDFTQDEKAFMDALGHRESSDDYQKVSKFGYLGRYQFGESALEELGYFKKTKRYWGPKNHWVGEWTGKHNIYSRDDFLRNHKIQDIAAKELFLINWRYIKHKGLHDFVGKEVQGIKITKSGLIAGVHLLGVGGLYDFLVHNKKVRDGLGTEIKEYLELFNEYKLSLDQKPESTTS